MSDLLVILTCLLVGSAMGVTIAILKGALDL